jgi:nucleotide-binding universal stress UspA family protein
VGKTVKILIGYDGSEGADLGVEGLRRAGLPPQDVEALVVTVAEVWLPPPPGVELLDETFPLKIPEGVKRMRARVARLVEQAEALAERGAERVRRIFPRWAVGHEARGGSPAFELLRRADEWQPLLIVVGSHGHTALGRFVLGSVSQKVLMEARASVHVARRATGTGSSAARVVLGVDGSVGARAAGRAVAARNWTPGSEVRVVVAQDLMQAFPASLLDVPAEESADGTRGAAQAEQFAAAASEELRAELGDRGVTVSSVVDDGPPKQALVRLAEEFGADCIFTGATGYSSRAERFLLGSVSAAVAARAHCSVEVIRG